MQIIRATADALSALGQDMREFTASTEDKLSEFQDIVPQLERLPPGQQREELKAVVKEVLRSEGFVASSKDVRAELQREFDALRGLFREEKLELEAHELEVVRPYQLLLASPRRITAAACKYFLHCVQICYCVLLTNS